MISPYCARDVEEVQYVLGDSVKRFGHLVLVALVLQLTGVVRVCAPDQPMAAHDCCAPPDQKSSAPSASSVPECCFMSAVRERGSLAPAKVASEHVTQVSQATRQSPLPAIALSERSSAGLWRVSHPVSPPISPLFQTCLLLI